MNRKSVGVLVASVSAGLVLLSACGESAGGAQHDAAPKPSESAVPAGVQSQYSVLEEEISEAGGETTSGEWRIGYIVEAAEPWFEPENGKQSFREPAKGETHHIEIIPMEKSSGRVIPDVPITVEVVDAQGKVVDSQKLNFYYSEFFHYANNFSIPENGKYTLRAKLSAPTFFRHGESGEQPALAQGAQVEFADVELTKEG